MAKSSNFFGLRRGSTKNFTFSVLEGVQITKERVTQVKNPRTAMQMAQRCKLKVLGLAYSSMKQIVDHSFEGVKYGRMSMQKFSSTNFPLLVAASKVKNAKFGFAPFKGNTVPMGQYIVSMGSLARPNIEAMNVSIADGAIKIALPAATSSDELATTLGVKLGDLITFVALVQNSAGLISFVWCRFHLPSTAAPLSVDSVEVESNWSLKTSFEANKLSAVVKPLDFTIDNSAAAVYDYIRSAKSSTAWLRSTARLNNVIGQPNYKMEYSEALATFPVGAERILNGGDTESIVAAEMATLTVNAVNSGTDEISTLHFVTTGAGNYAVGSTVVATLAKEAGGVFADAVAKLNGNIITQNPKGTVTFEIQGNSTLEWDLKSGDGSMGS